jgi:septal ring factor EnvC (AmiA/AmiB activator)
MPLFERMRLVIALTEVNSRHLRGESRRAGAEIELACALVSEKRDGASNDGTRDIAQLRARLSDAEHELRSIEFERAQLEGELANLDATISDGQHGSWQ